MDTATVDMDMDMDMEDTDTGVDTALMVVLHHCMGMGTAPILTGQPMVDTADTIEVL